MSESIDLVQQEAELTKKYSAEVVSRAKEIKESGILRKEAVVVARNDKGEILVSMAAKPFEKLGLEIWSLPQGGEESDDADETMQTVASREFGEEFGINALAENYKAIDMGDTDTTQAFDLSRICYEIVNNGRPFAGKEYTFFGLDVGNTPVGEVDETEVKEYRWLSPIDTIKLLQEKGGPDKFEMQRHAIENFKK